MGEIKYYRCDNRARCKLAQERKTIEIGGGKTHDCPCKDPECEKKLREIPKPSKGIPKNVLILAGGAILLCILIYGVTCFLPKGTGCDKPPQTIEAELEAIWPWLKK